MSKYTKAIKDKVRLLRKEGLSLNEIQTRTHVPKTTIYDWIADVPFSEEQKKKLKQKALLRLQEGREKAQKSFKEERHILQQDLRQKGISDIGQLTEKELFVTGVALYWGEGFKNDHERRLGFCNSDPTMIKFYLHWLEKSLGIDKKDLLARVTLNKSYAVKTEEIESYWSNVTGIPLNQFIKPFYQSSIWKKQFNSDTYHGVLRIHVRNSLEYLLRMRGWIEGLRLQASQGSLVG